MSFKQCQVCNEAQSKYKCPSCVIPYCSLVCFKKHKETPCSKAVSAGEKPSVDPKPSVARPVTVDKGNEVLQQLELESIASSTEIRNALKNERLQKLIIGIDYSQDPETELDKAMELEEFRIFTDKILSAMGPQPESMGKENS
ncbi:hypothetical protein K2173_025698 [Erythroxylum novogranatense]|uniref:HIT-type domain-containing protein n=1 Tax=Erythroxylum novogranatense TaxID=1862640 RepID=A0AAV8SBF2_9ROSI|nr:hypothetical protein K2173_025698 [Erythroxylum novogranatense]